MLKNISAVIIALVFLLFHSWQVAAAQKMLEDISFESSGNGEERIIFKLNGTYIPKIFTLQGKQPRVVFDFKDTAAAKIINNIINTNGELIKRIRVGIHKGDDPKTRVVLDLRPNKNINIRQDFDKKEKALVISVYHAGSEESAAEQKPAEEQKVPQKTVAKKVSRQPEKKQKPEPAPAVTEVEEKTAAKKADQSRAQEYVEPVEQAPVIEPAVEQKPGMPTLLSITFDNNSNRGEMVLFKLNEFHPPIVFGIEEGTPRVVCDFKDTAAGKDIPASLKTAGKFIRKIRVGEKNKENKLRVVLDLVPNYSYDLQQVFFKEENLFVIIINTLGNAPIDDPAELLK